MAIDYGRLRDWRFEERIDTYDTRDCIIYALGLGYGSDPLCEASLRFLHEHDTLAVPTLLATVGGPGAWATDARTGIDWLRILHGEHRMRFHQPVASAGSLRSRTRVSHVVDKGADKGALVVTTRTISDARSDVPIATVEHVSFCRADGGFGAGDAPLAPLPASPAREADATVRLTTLPQAALLYRLNGDLNPIHILPSMACEAGFDRPILHGLCTYGMAARALIATYCPTDPQRLGHIAARFSAPFYPGETLCVDLWRDGAQVYFRARSEERGVVVLTHGVAGIEPSRTDHLDENQP